MKQKDLIRNLEYRLVFKNIMSHSVWVMDESFHISHKWVILIFRKFADAQQRWLISGYRIKKKFVPRISNDWEFESPIFNYSNQPIRSIPSKPSFDCKICGKKAEFRRALQRHITAVHKVKCVVHECPKYFWKPMPGNEQRFNQALLRHHAAKHFSSN